MRGHNPDWANLPRRKCDDCGKGYKPKQPLREGTRGFCSDNCRKSYHKHGGAYRKLKGEMMKLVTREMTALARFYGVESREVNVIPYCEPYVPKSPAAQRAKR